MGSAKRGIDQVEGGPAAEEPSLLYRIRNMWQFANLCQWIYLFGKAVKIPDDVDIEEIETECLKSQSSLLLEVGLALLKNLSSHRGLNADLFDEYARRQFVAKAPDSNPFGTGEFPARFNDFDVFTKIRVLQQMTQWTMIHPERIREKMDEQRDIDQASWRIEPYGWDSEDRTYFVLDDNRIYRLTESPPPPPPAPKPKSKHKKSYRFGSRSSKRRRVSQATHEDNSLMDDDVDTVNDALTRADIDDGLGGMKWECVAVTLQDVSDFLQTLQRTRDDNEKTLRAQITDHLVPILEKQEDSRRRKAQQRERELLNLAKMASAKRSSRIANKLEHQKAEEQARAEERRRLEDANATRKAEQQRLRLEKERDLRLMSREKRLQEREARRLQHQEELAQLSEDSRHAATSNRLSERRLQAEMEKNKRALRDLEADEADDDDWMFDCVCGVHGHVDDGTHSIACERCNVWQHSKCVDVSEKEAESPDFHFICSSCRRRESEAIPRPRTIIKIKTSKSDTSAKTVETDPIRTDGERAGPGFVVEIPRASSRPEPTANTAASTSGNTPAHVHAPARPPDVPGTQQLRRKDDVGTDASSPGRSNAAVSSQNSAKALPAFANGSNGPRVHGGSPGASEQEQSNGVAEHLPTHSPAPVTSGTPMLPYPTVQSHQARGVDTASLPPPSISPTKQSPPLLRQPNSPRNGTVPGALGAVMPPSATLSPVAHKPNPTPPVKVVDSAQKSGFARPDATRE